MFGSTGSSSQENNWNAATGFSNPNSNSSGLFGKTPASSTGGLFGNSSTSNLFGKDSTSNNSGLGANKPLFGASNTSATGGLQAPSNTLNSGGLFSAANNTLSTNTLSAPGLGTNILNASGLGNNQQNGPSPYNFNTIISGVKRQEASIPQSITQSVFGDEVDQAQPEKKRKFSYLEKLSEPPKSSLLSKLGQVFNIFLYEAKTKSTSSSGIFSSPDYIEPPTQKATLTKHSSIKDKNYRRSYTSLENRSIGDVKRLVIASKPVKFHLIDTDKVFKPKRRRIVSSWTASASTKADDDEISSSDEEDVSVTGGTKRFPYRINTNERLTHEALSGKSTFEGEAFQSQAQNGLTSESPDGYWCTPSISELESMQLEDLSNVENFIIGRKGYGQIAFNFPVDLSGVAETARAEGPSIAESLFGNIVQILEKHVIVYENSEEKPPVGFGLNIPATITLERMKPKDGVSTSTYIKLLKRQLGMEFVNYDPITYVWTFKVKHFSIWGLVDDNDEEDGTVPASKRFQESRDDNSVLDYSKIYEDKRYNKELRNQKLSNYTRGVPGGWKHNHFSTSSPINIKRQLVADEIDNHLKVYEDDGKARKLSEQVSEITIELDQSGPPSPALLPVEVLKSSADKKNDVDYLKNLVSILPSNQNMDDIVQEKAFEPQITNDAMFESIQNKPNLPVAGDWLVQLELANDYTSALLPYVAANGIEDTKGQCDHDLALEKLDRSLFAEFNQKAVQSMSTPLSSPKTTARSVPKELRALSSIIDNLIGNVEITSRDNDFPRCTGQGGLTFAKLGNDDYFALASALFDRERYAVELDLMEMDVVARQELLKQRGLFEDWLCQFLSSVADRKDDRSQDCFQDIIDRLVVGDIKGAVLSAQESLNPHLSVLLTLVDSNDDAVRNIASNQVTEWKDTDTLAFIPPNLLRVYKLLSGDLEAITDGSWQQVLASKFFYSDSQLLVDIIGEVVDQFDVQVGANDTFDILRLYVHTTKNGIKDVVTWIKNAGWKIEKAWLFSLMLTSGGSHQTDQLSAELGDVLELRSLWREAVFVYSHLNDDDTCRSKIRQCVINYMQETKSIEDQVLRELRIPEALLHEAAAIRAQKDENYWQACRSFISAKLWKAAHDCIINHLGPETIVSNDPSKKLMLLDLTSRFPDNGFVVPTWSHGAGLYTNYISLVNGTGDAKSTIDDLLTNIPHFNGESNFYLLVALKMISRKVGDSAINAQVSNYRDRVMALRLGENERNYFRCRLETK